MQGVEVLAQCFSISEAVEEEGKTTGDASIGYVYCARLV